MERDRIDRRLTAILAIDMVGYSRHMEIDEVGTFRRLKRHRFDIIDPVIAEYHGRIVKEIGDGLLVVFRSVVDAVKCAFVVQKSVTRFEAAEPTNQPIEYRIGVNHADVITEGDDIYGHGVNLTARLEQLAEPGGVCVSPKVLEEVRNKVDFDFERLTDRSMNNIKTRICPYRVLFSEREEPVGDRITGTVKVAATEGLAALWLTPRLLSLKREHPDLNIEIITGNDLVDLSTREADIALRFVSTKENMESKNHLGGMKFSLFAADSYRQNFGMPEKINEVFDHLIIDHTVLQGEEMKAWRNIVSRHKAIVLRTNSSVGYLTAINEGMGIGLLPEYITRAFPSLVKAEIRGFSISKNISLLARKDANNVPRIRLVMEHIREQFRKDALTWFSPA